MTPEELTDTIMHYSYKARQKILTELFKNLEDSKARADKAEDMVSLCLDTLEEFHPLTPISHGTAYRKRGEIVTNQNVKAAAQASRKRICDEIVGRIEAEKIKLFKKDDPLFVQDYDIGKEVAYRDAIDIVKSVLGGEG